eukprot:TRINITY_DN1393_c0_g1_i11.p1 TRINITY_DN1393_c0_g1~~TRINITY_DN1393_c0_g1_i11.p1  ORF type:complete len:543 (+),score=276.56 TRINITY_DN1393_c0_g1_i11:197-1630(+)
MAPALWRFRRSFTLQDFTMELNLNADNQKSYPVLSRFLAEEQQLRGLRHLPAFIEWQNMLLNRYSRRLDHDNASNTTVADVLASAPEPHKWAACFEGFRSAWNETWRFVDRYGCMPIPVLYKNVIMDPTTPITFCLPSEKDEGICPLALARFLGEKHNTFITAVDELLLTRGEELQRAASRQNVVSSKFFSEAHALQYELAGGFLPFVEQQCVQFSETGNLVYDFKNAEQFLLDMYLSGKPLIDLEVRMMQYIGSDGGSSSINIDLLRQKLKQEPLPKDILQLALKELGSPQAARHCLELLETCVSFLQETGGHLVQQLASDVAEKTLGEYVRTLLLMEDGAIGSQVVSQQVRLKHIESLYNALRDHITVDPFANVRPKYREPIDEKTAENLVNVVKSNQLDLNILLPILKNFITSNLSEDLLSSQQPIKHVIGYLEANDTYLVDMPWFANFPEDLLMCNVVEVFNTLRNAQAVAVA